MERKDSSTVSSPPVAEQATLDIAAASRRLLDSCSAEESSPLRALRRAVATVERSTVKIAFGGHFKAGKSSLINALLDRAILPVKDRPETGVACHIRSGEADRCSAESVDGIVEIPCTTAGIASVSTLLDERGEARKNLATIRRIQLVLENAPLEPNVIWIDPPGLNDIPEMDDRLREVAEEADLLVWVLNSQQLLSEVEQAFLARYVATHGASALAFIIHVFLQQNPEAEWNRFLSQSSTQLLNKIHSFVREVGSRKSQETPTFLASAVGMQLDFGHYGGTALHELLGGGSNDLRELVHKARHERLSLAIRESFDLVEERAGAERVRLATARAESERARAAAAGRISDYRAAVQSLLRGFVSLFTVEVQRISGTMTSNAKPGILKPDGAYGRDLTNDLRTLAAQLLASLDKDLRAAARSAEVLPPSASVMQAVNAQFAIPDLLAPVPPLAQTEKMAMAKTITFIGLILILVGVGCVIFPIGLVMLVLAGLDTNQKRKVENDQLQATCKGITAAAEWMIGTFGSREEVALNLLVEAARETVPEPAVDPRVQRLLEISDTLAALRTASEPRAIPT